MARRHDRNKYEEFECGKKSGMILTKILESRYHSPVCTRHAAAEDIELYVIQILRWKWKCFDELNR